MDQLIKLVIARAGSGKTATLVQFIAQCIENGIKPSEIFMTTFTNAGVREFKERITSKLEGKNVNIEDAHITTFHGFALEVVKDNFTEVGFSELPRECNPVDKARIIDSLVSTKRFTGPDGLYKKGFDGVVNIVNVAIAVFDLIGENPEILENSTDSAYEYMHMLSPNARENVTISTMQELIDEYPNYRQKLLDENIILFSDMEPMFHQILDAHPGYLEKYGFKVVVLDEFQDSNEIQMETVKKLSDVSTVKCIVAVGDDGQSIYGFRKAVVDNIVNFEEKIGKPVETINMLENWRSTPEILELADDVLALNENKTEGRTIAGRKSNGRKPIVSGFHNTDKEYSYIVEEAIKNYNAGTPWHRQCIIMATNKELVKMIEYLAEKGIPYVLKNPMKYMDNSRVKAILSFIENAFWQQETNYGYFAYLGAKYNGEMLKMFSPEEVTAQMEEISNVFANIENLELAAQREILHKYLDEIRGGDEIYESFLDEYLYSYRDIEEELRFIQDFKRFGAKMEKRMEQDYEGIVLTTAHSSKGLEWDIVYNSITGYDSKILHSSRHHDEVEEKRRLLYVSMTRAREMLYVTGQYIVPGTKSVSAKDGGPTYNQFVMELYQICGMEFNPIDYEEEARKKEKRKEAYEKRRKKQIAEYCASNSRELSAEEKKEYDKMVLGSYQAVLPF